MNSKAEQINQKCREAQKLKQTGNAFFKQKQYIKALRSYHQANLYLSGLIDKNSPMAAYSKQVITEQETAKISQLKFSIYMNMGQIYIFQNKFDKSKDILLKAKQIKTNTKLKYRLAIVQSSLGNFQQSTRLLNEVVAEDPTMKDDVLLHLARIKDLEKKSNQKSKQMFAKFFSSS